jgi:hypothetical protein
VSIANFAAKLAADLIDDLDKLEHGMHLKLTFTVEACDYPDQNDMIEPVTVTHEALFSADEWKWTKVTHLNEFDVVVRSRPRRRR